VAPARRTFRAVHETSDVENRITAWCIDCEDPDTLAAFWTVVLGWVVTDRDEDGVSIKPSSDAGWGIDCFAVPDGPKRR
jgi:hypothetical protein